jgi:RND family efflux transporter MFP subunit
MNRKLKLSLPFIIIFIGIMAGVIMIRSRPKIEKRPVSFPPPLVRASMIHLQDYQLVVNSQGTVSPRTESELVSQVSGQVIGVAPQFAPGGFFRKQDVLIKIDPRDYEFSLSRLKARVAQAQLRLAQEEAEASIARQEWERLGKEEEPDPLVLRIPQLAEARASYEAAQAELKQAELNLQRTKIVAPFDGRVRVKKADVGQVVNPGAPLATVYSVDYAEVRLAVPDDEIGYLDCCLDYRTQNPAVLDIDVKLSASYGGNFFKWSGKIVRVEGEIDPLSHMITLVARIKDPYGRDLQSERPPLAVGMFVEAEIIGRRVDDVAVIPRSALRGDERLLIIDKDNKLHFRNVEVLRADFETVIISSGLNEGERICISPLEAVVDGMEVRVVEEMPQDSESLKGSR